MKEFQPNLLLDLQMQLGEGPMWDAYRGRLFFVDIKSQRLHWYTPTNHQHGGYQMDRMPTALAIQQDHNLMIAYENQLITFVPETEETLHLRDLAINSNQVRTNDAKTGPDHCYYMGTMDREENQQVATLYKVDANLNMTPLFSRQVIANGLDWSPDNSTMYYIDSGTCCVQAFDFDSDSSKVAHERTVVNAAERGGVPDGMTIDTEGHLWVAHNGAGFVARYDYRNGEMLARVDVPSPVVTCCTFGGHDMRTLYITTGTDGLSEEQKAQNPHSGGLFAVDLPWEGFPVFHFHGQHEPHS